jgi:CheY-like chemotaxis protein
MRILVVDDHQTTLELMRLTLSSLGHVVTATNSVAEALVLLAESRPDVILSDLVFPSAGGDALDGHDLAREVRSRSDERYIGLVAVTGAATPSARRAAIDSGFDHVVVKPFDLESLIDQIGAFDGERYRDR